MAFSVKPVNPDRGPDRLIMDQAGSKKAPTYSSGESFCSRYSLDGNSVRMPLTWLFAWLVPCHQLSQDEDLVPATHKKIHEIRRKRLAKKRKVYAGHRPRALRKAAKRNTAALHIAAKLLLVLLDRAGLAARRECLGQTQRLDQLHQFKVTSETRHPWHKARDNRNSAKPQWKITSRGNSVIPRGLLDFQGVDTKEKSSHTADDVFWLGWESTPVMSAVAMGERIV
eukprot:1161696-Pelagomonas_calceolata.AAC.3